MVSRKWPPLRLHWTEGNTPLVRAGYVHRGRYTAVCWCGAPMNFRIQDRMVTCDICQRIYESRPMED